MNKQTVINYYERPENNPKRLPVTHRIAEAIDVSRQAVEKWPDPIPERAAYRVQTATMGKLRVDPATYRRTRRTVAG